MVACISFKVLTEGKYDLTRYASSENVLGGFSKLLSKFKKENLFEEIITFANLDYSSGDLYEKTGFKKVYITGPNYFYYGSGLRYSRQQCMKHKLPDLLGEKFDENLTEKENMLNNKFLLIYDSGSIKYSMKK